MKAADVAMLGRLFAFRTTVANPPLKFLLKGKAAAGVADHFASFVAVRVHEVVFAEQAAAVAGDPADAPLLQ